MKSLLCLRCRSNSRKPAPNPATTTQSAYPSEPPISLAQHGGRVPQTDSKDVLASASLGAENPKDPTVGSDRWTAAYREAVSQLDDDVRAFISKEQDLQQLFNGLEKVNDEHRDTSMLRQGLIMIQKPLRYIDLVMGVAQPVAGLEPSASAAFGIVQSVTTLAKGIVQVEESLNSNIAEMLKQMSVIDGCDSVSQKYCHDAAAIHDALVFVYNDLLVFYYTVIQVLTMKATVLSFISEQFKERIPAVVSDFEVHTKILGQQIQVATSAAVKRVESLLINSKIQQLLGSDKVRQVEAFHLTQKKLMATKACEWAVLEQSFTEWRDSPSANILALFGSMGYGKTVTMAFIIEHIKLFNRDRIPSALLCYHYCRDDESGNALYVMSSLVQQLLSSRDQFKLEFSDWYEERRSEDNRAPTQDSAMLADFFFKTIRNSDRPAWVLIDGLDECDEESRIELLAAFKEQLPSIPGLKVCMSSRYYAETENLLQDAFKVRMPKDPERDAAIVSHMVNKRLPFLDDPSKMYVITRLSKLADGSMIWVHTAVSLLAQRKTTAIAKLEDFLRDELPGSRLSDMYGKLFVQITSEHDENQKVLEYALEFLATAERPLSMLELAWAVALRDPANDIEGVKDFQRFVETRRLQGFLSPFIHSVDFKDEKMRQVRLVHQSLREQIFKSPPRLWAQPRSHVTVPEEHKIRRRSELHGEIAKQCVRYLLAKDIQDLELFSEEQTLKQTLDSMPGMDVFGDGSIDGDDSSNCDDTEQKFDPSDSGFGEFFTYASCYWLLHMRKGDHRSGPPLSDVLSLATAETMISKSWWEQFHRPDCTLKVDESQARLQNLDPWTIVSLYGSETLLLELLQQTTKTSVGYSSALMQQISAVQALLAIGDMKRITMLMQFKPGEDLEHPMTLFGEVLRHWSRRDQPRVTAKRQQDLEPVFEHMEAAFDEMITQQWGNEVLCLASLHGCIPVLKRLFSAASHNPAFKQELLRTPHRPQGTLLTRHQSIGEAAWENQRDAVAFLLAQDGIEAHLRYADVAGNTVFHKAVRYGNLEIMQMLSSAFPEGVNLKDKAGDSPLQMAVFERPPKYELVRLLLTFGRADARCGYTGRECDWDEPLHAAARAYDFEMIKILVESGGVDPLSLFERDENVRDAEPNYAFIGSLGHLRREDSIEAGELCNLLLQLSKTSWP